MTTRIPLIVNAGAAQIQELPAGDSLSITGNITANYFIGNGSQLTGIAASGNVIYNGDSSVDVVAPNGNVVVTTNDGPQWIFGTNGTLTLPQTATIVDTNDWYIGIGKDVGPGASAAVSIGYAAGNTDQHFQAVAIGPNAGQISQSGIAVAVGASAGSNTQGQSAVAIGDNAAANTQGEYGIAVGSYAGNDSQGGFAIAIGYSSGYSNQGNDAVAIGDYAGGDQQGTQAIAIGLSAGASNQGNNAIAIGANAGENNQAANSIIINATGNTLNGTNAGFYVAPVRNDTGNVTNAVYYNTTTHEITYGPAGGGGTPGGSNTQVQFNDNGVFGGSSSLTFNKSDGNLNVNGGFLNAAAVVTSGRIQAGTSLSAVGNATVGNILTNGYYYANGTPVSFGNGTANTGNLAFSGATMYINGSETDLYVTANIEGYAYLRLPTDATANVTSTLLTNNGGNVEIWASDYPIGGNTYQYKFDNTGYLNFIPGGSQLGSNSGTFTIIPNSDYPEYNLQSFISFDNDIHLQSGNIDKGIALGRSYGSGAHIRLVGNVPLNMGDSAGDIVIHAQDYIGGDAQQWHFGVDGNLTTPTGAGDITMSGGNIANIGNIYLFPAGIDPVIVGGESQITIQTDRSNNATNLIGLSTTQLALKSNAEVFVNANTSNWYFQGSGNTVFPSLNVVRGDTNTGNLSGQTLRMGDGTTQALITTPDGTANTNISSQRLIINPGKGQDGTNGEGGDIYLWAGRGGTGDGTNGGGSGGDIKIRGGQGMAHGDGGYIRMEAGDSNNDAGAGGYIQIAAGYTNGPNPGYVSITGGYNNGGNGGNANITGGHGSGIGGNVFITGGSGGSNGGNVNIQGGGGSNVGSIFLNTPTYLPPLQVNSDKGEQAVLNGTRIVVPGIASPTYAYAGQITYSETETFAWAASSDIVQSAKITFAVQTTSATANWEQFDVAVLNTDGSNVSVVVSNRIRSNAAINWTAVSANVISGIINVYLTLPAGQTTAYLNYQATEFNLMIAP